MAIRPGDEQGPCASAIEDHRRWLRSHGYLIHGYGHGALGLPHLGTKWRRAREGPVVFRPCATDSCRVLWSQCPKSIKTIRILSKFRFQEWQVSGTAATVGFLRPSPSDAIKNQVLKSRSERKKATRLMGMLEKLKGCPPSKSNDAELKHTRTGFAKLQTSGFCGHESFSVPVWEKCVSLQKETGGQPRVPKTGDGQTAGKSNLRGSTLQHPKR